MGYDSHKLAKMIVKGHPMNREFLPRSLKVMAALDRIPAGTDFDITEIEDQELGPLLTTESARLAKMIGTSHSRGSEWVAKWNARVAARTPEEEDTLNQAVLASRGLSTATPNPEVDAEMQEALDHISEIESTL